MQKKTFRPSPLTVERLERIANHLGRANPEPPSLTRALSWAVWYVEQLLRQGKLTQLDLAAGKPEGRAEA